jgi:hypothetical protein
MSRTTSGMTNPTVPSTPRTDSIDDAMQYAIAFMNDPEGLAGSREEWRDRLRDALHVVRALAASDAGPDGIDVEPRHTEGQGEMCDPDCPHWAWSTRRLSRESDR